MERADGLVTERAVLPFVPMRDDIPNKAVVGTDFDLAEAFLAAVLALGPAGTFFQAKRGLGEEGADGGFGRCDVNRFGLVGFGASDQAFSFVSEVRADSGN